MTFWRGRSTFVTGATGFLGRALTAELDARGAEVARLLRPGAENACAADIVIDIHDTDALAQALLEREIDTVFHLAAQSMPDAATRDPTATFALNIGGTWSVLDACRRVGRPMRVVIASSVKVYGEGGGAALEEDAPLAGKAPYDVSKICAEMIGRCYGAHFGLRVASARTVNLYGPGDTQLSRIVPGALRAVLNGERPLIHSDGRAERDYLFIDDAVEAFLRLAERLDRNDVAGSSINLGTGDAVSVVEIAREIAAAGERPDLEPLVLGERDGGVSRQRISTARAEHLLGWRPAASRRDRLVETVSRTAAAAPAMGRPPRIFIGIPTLNRPEMVRETVESLLAQSFDDFAAVVSDNVSAPGIAEAVGRYVEGLGDARIRFVAQPVNRGEYGQGRYLFAESQRLDAEYFMILHDDDRLRPDALARSVAALDAAAEAALFVANPSLMDVAGTPSPDRTRRYLDDHGRTKRQEGLFDLLNMHMACGFTPISGTLFRTAAIAAAGLADDDCEGNFPFECNVMLRLGDAGAQGWFSPETLLDVRFHDDSLHVYLKLMDNPAVVGTMLTLFERRRYTGAIERRRRVLVSRLRRADAMLKLRSGDLEAARRQLRRACEINPRSGRAWALRMLSWVAPGVLRARLPSISTRTAPKAAGGVPAGATAGDL